MLREKSGAENMAKNPPIKLGVKYIYFNFEHLVDYINFTILVT